MGHQNVTTVRVCTDHPVNLSKPSASFLPKETLKAALAEKHLDFLHFGGTPLDRLLRCDDPNQCKAWLKHSHQFNIIAKNLILKL